MIGMNGFQKKMIYIFNARLPTEKAHGYQICKMCEAFAANGLDLSLMHPRRHQANSSLRGQSVFDYYGIRKIFQVRTLHNWDVVRLERLLPKSTMASVFFVHSMFWGLYAALAARREKADIYYSRDSVVVYWLLRMGLPTVYEEHVMPKYARRLALHRMMWHSTLQLVIVLTSFIKWRFVEMGFPHDKVIVLPDGVDPSLFANLPPGEECRVSLGLPRDRLIIGYIGRFRTLDREKGIPELVQAMAHVPSVNGKEPLLLCVGGPLEAVPAYLELARRCGVPTHRLQFIDRVANTTVPLWIRACDLVTIPWPWTEFSAYFTSPLKLFEYMAAGVPIVATDMPSLREVLQHGENAWLVQPDDPSSLAQGIQYLLENRDLAVALARQAAQDVQGYTWEGRAAQILQRMVRAPPV
jgi:glycosyltransferase involved in cell wall biosynthesis